MSDSTTLIPDAASAPFFDGCAAGRLMLQHCPVCGTWSWPVVTLCPSCGSLEVRWESSAGTGAIYSFAIVHRAFSLAYQERVPYPVVMVDLDEGLRITTNVTGFENEALAVGARVKVRFKTSDGIAYPVFAPAHAG